MSVEAPSPATRPSVVPFVAALATLLAVIVVIGLNAIYRQTQGFNARGSYQPDAVAFVLLAAGVLLCWCALKLRAGKLAVGVMVLIIAAVGAWLYVPVGTGSNLASLAQESWALASGFEQVSVDDVAGFSSLSSRLDKLETAAGERVEPLRAVRATWLAAIRSRLAEAAPRHPLTAEGFAALQADHEPYRGVYDLSNDRAAALQQFGKRRAEAFVESVKGLKPGDLDGFRSQIAIGNVLFIDHFEQAQLVQQAGSEFLTASQDAVVRADAGEPTARRARLAAFRDAVAQLPPLAGKSLNEGEGRKKICLAALDAARWELRPRIERDDYAGLVAITKTLESEWGQEAKAVGLSKEVTAMREATEYMAELDKRSRLPEGKK